MSESSFLKQHSVRGHYEPDLFVNRVEETEAVFNAIRTAHKGQRGGTNRFLVLRGPVGIGKSWLLQHLNEKRIGDACQVDCHVTNVYPAQDLLSNEGLQQVYRDLIGDQNARALPSVADYTVAVRQGVRARKEQLIVLRLDSLEDFEETTDRDRVSQVCRLFLGQGLANEFTGTVVIILAAAREVQKLQSVAVPSLNDTRLNIELQRFEDADVLEMLTATSLAAPDREPEIQRLAQGNPYAADLLAGQLADDSVWQTFNSDASFKSMVLNNVIEVLLQDYSLSGELRPLLIELARMGQSSDTIFSVLQRTPYVRYHRDTKDYAVIEPLATLIREASLWEAQS